MTIVDMYGFTAIQNEILALQASVPEHSLDWNIYQGQVDLLRRVSSYFTKKDSTIVQPSVEQDVAVVVGRKSKTPAVGDADLCVLNAKVRVPKA